MAFSSEDPPYEFEFNQSTVQAFYFIQEVFIDSDSIEPEDWIGAFNGDVCVGARKWDASECGGGACDIPVMGEDGSEGTIGYMNTGNIPNFKVFDSSEQIVIDMNFYNYHPNPDDFSWYNSGFIYLDQLINEDYSFNSNMSNFLHTATITSVFSNDTYQMGSNDILVSYFGEQEEIRGISTSSSNLFGLEWSKLFFSSIHLDDIINDLSFKYYNYEHKLIFNISQSFSTIYADNSFGNAINPIILNVDGNAIILGCTDIDACNYNIEATLNDGLCEYRVDGYNCEGDVLAISSEIQLLTDFMLITAYPNPFNPIINIALDIKDNDYLDIGIVDINGFEVNKIFKGYKVSGKYDYQWDASTFSSGIYFIVIKKSKSWDVLFEKICLIK